MKILLAVDGSDFSEAAIRSVLAQFAPKGNEVRVFRAVDWAQQLPTPYDFAEGPEGARAVLAFRDAQRQAAAAYVARVADELREAGFTVSTDTGAESEPRTAILDAAAAWPADLIVVGSHGRTGLERFLLGSVSERVARHAPCSVEIVRPARSSTMR